MNLARLLLRLTLGRRLPVTHGKVTVSSLAACVTISRDRWGIPYIRAENDADAWFGLGFCHAQDRAFQLESLLRVARGTVSEMAGPGALPVDRLSRRIGFRCSAERQLPVLGPDERATIEAYARGINAGLAKGLRRRPHEFVLLRSRPSRWQAADVLAVSKLQSFFLGSGWDTELARLRILSEDGLEALAALEPLYPDWLPASAEPGRAAGPALDRIAAELSQVAEAIGSGGSNNWALDGSRTATGRPILANDPHLSASLPPHWYLCHLQTPEWSVAGGTFVGGPTITCGHNGFCAWGLTAGLVDNADLFIEEISPDGAGVRQGDGWVSCPVRREEIRIRGDRTVVEEVLETPLGPIIGPALDGEQRALSLRAVWLDPLPVVGLLRVHRAQSFDQFRRYFADWPGPSLNMVYADVTGRIGWQLTGQAPVRRKGSGVVPQSGSDVEAGWSEDLIPFEQMPYRQGSDSGFLASANARPVTAGEGPFLGEDWLDGYRFARVVESLAERHNWDVTATQGLQMDVLSIPWREMREIVVGAPVQDERARAALQMLASWDGRVSADSEAAAVFELFANEMTRRFLAAKAPRSVETALARGFSPLLPQTLYGTRRAGQLVRLLREQPDGWFDEGWPAQIESALAAAVEALRTAAPADGGRRYWGAVRPLTLRHPIAARRRLAPIFNLGPIACGGDANTIAQAGVDPLEPLGNPVAVAALRMVVDVGNWDAGRFALPGGQSGNPLSPHYADQLPFWRAGRGVPIAWSEAQRRRAVRETVVLSPG